MTHATETNLAFIPLNKLVPWEGNVRKTGASDGIEALAANIAAYGLLQPLVVKKAGRGRFAIIAGRRRHLALSALAEEGHLAADAPVACNVKHRTANATEISLTENVMRVPMHPADQFDAFRELVDEGATPADIAARFGISEAAVRQILRLARVSPTVFEAYRNAALTLEQVKAFAVSDDHEAQDRVLADLSDWNDTPRHIRDALTQGDIRATDKRARFVTIAAYEEAGGGVRRDLFAQGDDGVFLLDAALLDRLALDKLRAEAERLRGEGWKWVEAVMELDRSETNFRERDPEPLPLSEEATAEHRRLADEYEQLFSKMQDDDEEASERLDAIQARIDELEDTETAYTPDTLALAGAIVTIGSGGAPEILRGLVRPEDLPEDEAKPRARKSQRQEHSAPLVLSLTEARSAAISATLCERPDIALAAVVHALAISVFDSFCSKGGVELSGKVTYFRSESKGAAEMRLARETWAERIPGDEAALWDWCLEQERDTLLELLAVCAAQTVNAVQAKEDRKDAPRLLHADALAKALNLDMTAWFTPTAENFFSRVARPTILKALSEAKGAPAKRSWDKLKKPELAALAEREVAGSGWLPEPLRA
jgi:ParB family transcriptional regulator, chromosome partitioning protein